MFLENFLAWFNLLRELVAIGGAMYSECFETQVDEQRVEVIWCFRGLHRDPKKRTWQFQYLFPVKLLVNSSDE